MDESYDCVCGHSADDHPYAGKCRKWLWSKLAECACGHWHVTEGESPPCTCGHAIAKHDAATPPEGPGCCFASEKWYTPWKVCSCHRYTSTLGWPTFNFGPEHLADSEADDEEVSTLSEAVSAVSAGWQWVDIAPIVDDPPFAPEETVSAYVHPHAAPPSGGFLVPEGITGWQLVGTSGKPQERWISRDYATDFLIKHHEVPDKCRVFFASRERHIRDEDGELNVNDYYHYDTEITNRILKEYVGHVWTAESGSMLEVVCFCRDSKGAPIMGGGRLILVKYHGYVRGVEMITDEPEVEPPPPERKIVLP